MVEFHVSLFVSNRRRPLQGRPVRRPQDRDLSRQRRQRQGRPEVIRQTAQGGRHQQGLHPQGHMGGILKTKSLGQQVGRLQRQNKILLSNFLHSCF